MPAVIIPSQASQPSSQPSSPLTCPMKRKLDLPTSPTKALKLQPQPDVVDVDPHCFIPPTSECSRAPCPALNALANHGYLPRSGRHITFPGIKKALQEAFGLSPGFALFMAVGSFTLLRRWYTHPFDLHETALHNLIEHDASLVHDDANSDDRTNCEGIEYAPVRVDPVLMRRFLSIAHPLHPGTENVYTTSDIAQYRVQREAETQVPLDALHAELGRAEFAMIIQIFGRKDADGQWYVDESVVAEFFQNQRFPKGWKPARVLHLNEAVNCTGDIRQQMQEIRRTKPATLEDAEHEKEWYCKVRKWFMDVLDTHAQSDECPTPLSPSENHL